MRKVILALAVSLDNFIEGTNGEVDWMTFDEETGIALNNFLQEIDTILYGRVSYELYGNYSPLEGGSAFEKDFYHKTAQMAKYVFSTSKTKFEGDPKIVSSDIAATIHNLKKQNGKNIWLYGGSRLVSTFMNLNLIDEIRLAIIPIILGGGTPLFQEINDKVKLKLLDTKTSQSGVVELSYEPIAM